MGLIARVLSFTRTTKNAGSQVSDVKCNKGGDNNNVTAENFQPAGDDSHPLPDDYALLNPVKGSGRFAVSGYVDIKNTPKAAAGDKRIYARDSNGDAVVELWLKNDSSAVLSNANGSITLMANGDVNINGAIIDSSGNISSPGTVSAPTVSGTSSVLAGAKELVNHTHPVTTAPGTTGPNN